MTSSMLTAIHAAVSAQPSEHDEGPDAGATGAIAPDAQEKDMTTISQADHEAAVTAAEARGHEAGLAAQMARLGAALGADGVKGDAGRMGAALDLAAKSPAMSGEDVAAFVTANVAVTKTSETAYEAERLAAAALAQPGGADPAPSASSGWGKAAERINRRNG